MQAVSVGTIYFFAALAGWSNPLVNLSITRPSSGQSIAASTTAPTNKTADRARPFLAIRKLMLP